MDGQFALLIFFANIKTDYSDIKSTFYVQVNPGVAHIFTFIGGPMFLLAIILFGMNLFLNLKDEDVKKYKGVCNICII